MHVGVSYGDPTAGLHPAVAVLAALLHRARTGTGQHIDLSQWETSVVVLADALMAQQMKGQPPARNGNRHTHMAPHGIFPAAGDDRWIAITAEDDDAWRRLTAALGHPEVAGDPRFSTLEGRQQNEDALEKMLAAWTAAYDPDELTVLLQQANVAAHTVATNRDLSESEHLEAAGAFVRHDHPQVGRRQHLGPPWRMNQHASGAPSAAPCLGADTDDVLRRVCGYDDADVARLHAAGVLS
jgi:crotonobetainyl-CoA:carnitine CoA-transferase CaiB-like acyl-CoA transferase